MRAGHVTDADVRTWLVARHWDGPAIASVSDVPISAFEFFHEFRIDLAWWMASGFHLTLASSLAVEHAPSPCWCGRQAHARGLCHRHYRAARYRPKARQARERAVATCHPRLAAHARGLCVRCFQREPDQL